MTERQRHRQACAENGRLRRENHTLLANLQRAQKEIAELEAANCNLQVERDAADVLLGEAIDQL